MVTDFPANLIYAQEILYDQECDSGINLATIEIESVSLNSRISQRDRELPTLTEFHALFVFNQSEYPKREAQLWRPIPRKLDSRGRTNGFLSQE